jgi:hypothetical protein
MRVYSRRMLMGFWCLGLVMTASVMSGAAPAPKISITRVPPATLKPGPDQVGVIEGKVQGIDGSKAKVVVFALGDMWYVQPFVGASDTEIGEGGAWKTDTHGGTQYAALLCKPSYKPPATTGMLPAVGGDVLAIAKANPK